jgi:glycosyltransferase involved in cell wall biosynthesis
MLYYISNGDFPGKEAHTIQQMRMCQAFQRTGTDVHFLHPSYDDLRKKLHWRDVADYYDLETRFDIKTIPSLQGIQPLNSKVKLASMIGPMVAWLVKQTLTGKITNSDVIYGRNYYPLFFYNEFRNRLPERMCPTVIFEHHDTLTARWQSRFFYSIDGLVTITHALARHDQQTYGISNDRCHIAPDGVDLDPYESMTTAMARQQLSIPEDEQVIMYTGHLYPSKGVDYLARAATNIDGKVYIVGGFPEDVERVRAAGDKADNLICTGFVNPSKIPMYQLAADILVAPYATTARDFLSPLKLFEYMAAGKPMIVSDLSVLTEVLTHKETAILVPPEQPEDLACAVNNLLNDPEQRIHLSRQARDAVTQYTWTRRAINIHSFIQSLAE